MPTNQPPTRLIQNWFPSTTTPAQFRDRLVRDYEGRIRDLESFLRGGYAAEGAQTEINLLSKLTRELRAITFLSP